VRVSTKKSEQLGILERKCSHRAAHVRTASAAPPGVVNMPPFCEYEPSGVRLITRFIHCETKRIRQHARMYVLMMRPTMR
jgi:hypothetical protein